MILKANVLKISSRNLNLLGIALLYGKDGINTDLVQAVKIFELAAKRDALINPTLAFDIFSQLFNNRICPPDYQYTIIYYTALHHFNNQRYKTCWHYLDSIPVNTPFYEAAQQKLAEIKQLARASLEQLFFRPAPDPTELLTERMSTLTHSEKITPFQKLSDSLEMYDPAKEEDLAARLLMKLVSPQKKQLRRQIQTEKHFFAIERIRNPKVAEVSQHLLHERQRLIGDPVSILQATNVPARYLIAAELAVMRASLSVMDFPEPSDVCSFPWTRVTKKTHYYQHGGEYYECFGNSEKVQYGVATISYKHRVNPLENHVGHCFIDEVGDYANIFRCLSALVTNDKGEVDLIKEQQLANWMLRFVKTGMPVTTEDLTLLNSNAQDYTTNLVMQIFYLCFIKEPARWMIPKDEDHELPLATAQLRAVRLIEKGFLHLRDVFAPFSDYGVFTGKEISNNIYNVKEKVERINKLYLEMIVLARDNNREAYLQFMLHHKDATPLSTRLDLHKELHENFGNAHDSDGEGYDSDTAEELYPGPYRFGQTRNTK